MINILPLNKKVQEKIKNCSLQGKFSKQIQLFSQNPKYPGLKTELLEPRQYGIYSFRIDRKYRAIFIFRPDHNAIEILSVTLHYK